MRGDIFAAGVVLAIAACICVLALVILDDGGREYSESNTMEYEDYKAIDGANILGTDGPIELVDIDGQTYIHAIGTGKATIVYDGGNVDRFKIVPAKADLLIINGQSNAAYHEADATMATTPERGTTFYFGTEDSMPRTTLTDYSVMEFYDFVGPDGETRVGDKGPEACRTWHELTGHKALWISLGIGGRQIATWDQPDGKSWTRNITIMGYANACLEDLPFDIKSTVVFWAQGESDYSHDTGYDNYIEKFNTLVDSADSAWGHDIDHWYLVDGRTVKCGWVNDAFEEIAESREDVSIVVDSDFVDGFTTANTLLLTDNLHYSQTGDNAVANAMVRHALDAQGGAPIYLIEQTVSTTVGTSVTVPTLSPAYTTDYDRLMVQCEWSSTPDWATAGTQTIEGTPVDGSRMLENAPTVLVATVAS